MPTALRNACGLALQDLDAAAVYRAICDRRGMRHFSGGVVVDHTVSQRFLRAAHHAPSIGLMLPWRLIRIRNLAVRQSIHAIVEQERLFTAKALGEREDEFVMLRRSCLRGTPP